MSRQGFTEWMACQALANCAIHHLAHPSYVELESLCRHPGGSPQSLSETKRSTPSDPLKTPLKQKPGTSSGRKPVQCVFNGASESRYGSARMNASRRSARCSPGDTLMKACRARGSHPHCGPKTRPAKRNGLATAAPAASKTNAPTSLAFDRFPFSKVESCAPNLANDAYRS